MLARVCSIFRQNQNSKICVIKMHDFVIFACFMCPAFCASRHDTCNGGRLLPTVFPRLIASAAKTPSLRLTHSQVYKESRCDQCLSIAAVGKPINIFWSISRKLHTPYSTQMHTVYRTSMKHLYHLVSSIILDMLYINTYIHILYIRTYACTCSMNVFYDLYACISPITLWFSGQLHDLPRASAHLLRARATRAAGDDCRAAAAR